MSESEWEREREKKTHIWQMLTKNLSERRIRKFINDTRARHSADYYYYTANSSIVEHYIKSLTLALVCVRQTKRNYWLFNIVGVNLTPLINLAARDFRLLIELKFKHASSHTHHPHRHYSENHRDTHTHTPIDIHAI